MRIIPTKISYVCHIFTTKGLAINVLIAKDKSLNTRFYKKKVWRNLVKFYQKRRPKTGICGIYLSHDNASSQKCDIIFERTGWLFSRTSTQFSLYSPPVTFFFFLVSRIILLVENTPPAKSWVPSHLTSLEVYPNTIMIKPLRIGLKDWNFVYLWKESTLMIWNKCKPIFSCHLTSLVALLLTPLSYMPLLTYTTYTHLMQFSVQKMNHLWQTCCYTIHTTRTKLFWL